MCGWSQPAGTGRFRTNTVAIEAANVTLWRASTGWKERDNNGFARRTRGSGGDWQIFAPGQPADGYGQFGLTEENGGVLLSTTALVFQAGVYPEMYRDFAGLVAAATSMSAQLGEGAAGVAQGPLLASGRGLLRVPMAAGSVPQEQCKAARRLPDPRYPPDRWGARWCDFYKSVSWNLPGAGAFVYSFAKGLLQLQLPIPIPIPIPAGDAAVAGQAASVSVSVSVSVWGTVVHLGAGPQDVALPPWAATRWPTELKGSFSIVVEGLNVGGAAVDVRCGTRCAGQPRVRGFALCCSLDASPPPV